MLEMAIISFFNAPFPTIAASDPEVAYSPTCGRIRNSDPLLNPLFGEDLDATYPKWHAKKVYMHLKFEVKTEIDREGRDRQSGDGAVVREPPNEIHAQQTEDVLDAETGFEVRVFDR